MGGAGVDPPSWKTDTFFLGPWLLVCQFIEICNQMEITGAVSNFERIFLYKGACTNHVDKRGGAQMTTTLNNSYLIKVSA